MDSGSIDWPRVLSVWRTSGRTAGTMVVYKYWSRRYVEFCVEQGARFDTRLTHADVRRFVAEEIGREATDTAPFAAVVRSGVRSACWGTIFRRGESGSLGPRSHRW